MSTRTNHKRTRLIALVTALLVVAGILGLAPKAGYAATDTTGDLEITKQFAGDDLAGTEEATFTVTVSEPEAGTTLPTTLTIGETTINADNNTFTFSLKTGQIAKFTEANPCKVSINETAMTGFTTTVSATRDNTEIEGVTSLPATVDIVKKTSAKVTVTNTKNKEEETTETGKLTVSKEVKGTEDQTLLAEEFDFTVQLTQDGKDLNGTFKYTGSKTGTINNGESISLKGGQSIEIEGIPAGVTYRVTEADKANWTPEKKELTGLIEEDKAAPAAFTNTYKAPGTGDLKITKTVVTDYLDKAIAAYTEAYDKTKEEKYKTTLDSLKETLSEVQAQKFTFTVKLTDKNDKELTGEYDYTGKVGGESVTGKKIKSGDTVELAHGDTITITGLDADTEYTVTETAASGYQVDKATQDGTISSNGAADATFKNTPVGGLVIKKNIQSRSGNDLSDALKEQEFTFTVNYRLPEYDSDSEAIVYKDIEEEEFAYAGDRSGKIKSGDTITLKGGESVTFSGLQVGMNARVEETPVTNWQASAKALSGDIRLNKNRTATFTNTYQDSSSSSSSTTPRTSTTTTRTSTPATSDDTNVVVPIVLGALAVGLVVVGRVARSKE